MSTAASSMREDERAIDTLVQAFFGLFSNRGGTKPDLRAVFELCIPQAIISKCTSPEPEVMALEAFIAPRERLLNDGTLTEFHEIETAGRTDIFGNIAQRVSTYRKAGMMRGTPFESRGIKVFQFIKGPRGWRIAAVSWDDEREGFSPDCGALTPSTAPR